MFHMGYFTSVTVLDWRGPFAGRTGTEWSSPRYWADAALALERGGYDLMVFEDSLQVHQTYGDSMEYAMRTGIAAKMDPVPFMPAIAALTNHIGLVPTMSTTFYPPFLAARLINTIDSMTGGRMGANLVTSSTHLAAQNFGLDKHVEHDERYAMADEWVEVVKALWRSWEPDAVVRDEETGVYADPSKVHTIDFEGRYFSSRGPLNTIPSPQGQPVICQAGGSPAGRHFAARHADVVVANVMGVDAMKAYRQDMDARLVAAGRKPQDLKILHMIAPVIGETAEEAEELRRQRDAASEAIMEDNLFWMSYYSGVDFAQFELDQPMPDISELNNGHQSTMADYAKSGAGRTLRELASTFRATASVELVGTPDSVAAQMGEVMDEVGGDGFLMTGDLSRRNVATVADGLAPALRRRGLIRDGYTYDNLRDNLLEF